jgi:hypothetical protein
MSTKVNKQILSTLNLAKEAKAKLVSASKEPKQELSNYMVSAVVLGAHLTEKQFEGCRTYLKTNNVPKGTINQIARFMAPNDGNERLLELFKDCQSKSLDDMLEHLETLHIVSYSQLRKACIVVSDEAIDKKLAKQLSDMNSDRVEAIVTMASKIRHENMANDQADDMIAKQSELAKISSKRKAIKVA